MAVVTSNLYVKSLTELIGIGCTLNPDGSILAVTGIDWGRVTVSPNGAVTANAGSLRSQTDGTLWINTDSATTWVSLGGGSTGWNLPDNVSGIWGTAAPGQVSSTYVSASNRWDLSGDSISQATAASGTDLRVETGTNTITGAVVGNASGTITLRTGATDSTNAGGTAGASGPISIRTGNSTSTLGTSGSTGEVALVSGDSADANSGNVSITTGTAAGTRGVFDLNAPTIDTTSQVTQWLGIDNTAAAVQIGSTGALNALSYDSTNATEEFTFNVGLGARFVDNIPVRFGTLTNDRWLLQYDLPNTRLNLAGANITGGGATQATRPFVVVSGNRIKNDANAGVPTSGAISITSGTTDMQLVAGGATGGASGALTFASGTTDVTIGANVGGASGAVTIGSGNTDASAGAVATGGATGNVIVRSGAAASTGVGATSGASGTAVFGSGGSEDANTGTVNLQSGNAAGVGAVQSGLITIRSGTVGGTGTTGGVTIVSGAPVGAGVSGNIALGSGNVAGAGTSGSVTITSGDAAGAGTSGSIAIRAGATVAGTRGQVAITGIRTAGDGVAAITAARILSLADSGGVFSVSQGAAYGIELPSPTTGPGTNYDFYLTAPGANNVTLAVTGAAATFVGTIINDVTSVIPATGSTLTFPSGVSALGDNIQIRSISTTLYLVRAVTSAAGGITIT